MIFLTSQLTFAANLREQDKQKHLAVSAGIATISYSAFRAADFNKTSSAILSFILAMGAGHIKEHSDPFYDEQDMQANAAGASLGLILPLSFQF